MTFAAPIVVCKAAMGADGPLELAMAPDGAPL
jgi:hypothetical protein